MFNIGEDYVHRLRSNTNQLYRNLKPKERICKIVTDHIQPKINHCDFKFIKSRMQLEKSVGDFKQAVWFRTSIKNYKDEIVNFEVHLKVDNSKYRKHCIENYEYQTNNFISSQVEYLDLWNQEYCDGWYHLQLDDNYKIAEKIAQNISNCSAAYLNVNSDYESSLQYRFQKFKTSDFFASLLIPDILILSKLTNHVGIQEEILQKYEDWKLTENGRQRIEKRADIFGTIERIINLL